MLRITPTCNLALQDLAWEQEWGLGGGLQLLLYKMVATLVLLGLGEEGQGLLSSFHSQ